MLFFQIQHRIFSPVFIGYGLKTGQGFYPGPIFFILLDNMISKE